MLAVSREVEKKKKKRNIYIYIYEKVFSVGKARGELTFA
jgi:hypothetical protein